jgi:acetoin utilization deacetylase AcuC-like enzyme
MNIFCVKQLGRKEIGHPQREEITSGPCLPPLLSRDEVETAMTPALLYDPLYLEHDTGQHPENAGRLLAVVARLREQGLWEEVRHLPAETAGRAALEAVHDPAYLRFLEEAAAAGGGWLTADTVMSERSFDAARLAAGAAIEAVRAVLAGEVRQAFSLSRPPGHHARPAAGMGFCLINTAAVAASEAVRTHGLERVFLVDFDVHHGNGTQEIFEADPRVFYASTHQYPAYPGTGALEETGRGAGQGYTLNVPLPAGAGDAGLLRAYDEAISPAMRRYRPQLLLVSAGYDAHWTNSRYLSSIRMGATITGFAALARRLRDLAEELCEGRLVFVQEGGYDPEALGWSVAATLDVLLDRPPLDPLGPPPESEPEPDVSRILEDVRRLHSLT